MGVVVSPELALVDDELRALARAELPPIDPDAFLPGRVEEHPVRPLPPPRGHHLGEAGEAARWLLVFPLGTLAGLLIGYWLGHIA